MHDMIRADSRAFLAVPVQQCEGGGVGNRQGTQQERVHETVDHRIGADAKSQGQGCHHAESRILAQRPHRVAQICQRRFDPWQPPLISIVLLHNVNTSELQRRRPSRFLRIHAGPEIRLGQHPDVRLHFIAS